MPEGLTRIVIAYIISFLLILTTFPMLGRFLYVGVNDYLVNTLMDQGAIDEAWNASVQVCAHMHNTTYDACAQFLADRGLSKESYYVQNSPWFPIPMSWWEMLSTWSGLKLLLALSMMFTIIIEAGGVAKK